MKALIALLAITLVVVSTGCEPERRPLPQAKTPPWKEQPTRKWPNGENPEVREGQTVFVSTIAAEALTRIGGQDLLKAPTAQRVSHEQAVAEILKLGGRVTGLDLSYEPVLFTLWLRMRRGERNRG